MLYDVPSNKQDVATQAQLAVVVCVRVWVCGLQNAHGDGVSSEVCVWGVGGSADTEVLIRLWL